MTIELRSISESEFQLIEASRRVIVNDHSRHFASFLLPSTDMEFAIAWRSDHVLPVLRPHPQRDEIWIGIDLRVACVQPRCPLIALSLAVPGYFQEFYLFDDCSLIVSETQILAINADYSVRSLTLLSDVPERIAREGNRLVITSLDGETISVSF
jgi:hypothetical protein